MRSTLSVVHITSLKTVKRRTCWKARLRSWGMRVVEVFIPLIDLCLYTHDFQQ